MTTPKPREFYILLNDEMRAEEIGEFEQIKPFTDCIRVREVTDPDKDQKCQAGCVALTGAETRHHKDCVFYPESLTKLYDDKVDEARKYREACEVMKEALEGIWMHIESGNLVRDISKDSDDDWLIMASALVTDIKRVHEALTKANSLLKAAALEEES